MPTIDDVCSQAVTGTETPAEQFRPPRLPGTNWADESAVNVSNPYIPGEFGVNPDSDADVDPELLERLRAGNTQALAVLFEMYRPRLWRIINFRLDHRLAGRVDAEDVLQESYLNAAQRIQHVFTDSPDGVFVWLRLIVQQTLVQVHRRYFGAKSRDVLRERSTTHTTWGTRDSESFSISSHLLGHLTSPSQAALRQELSQQLQLALETMSDLDREVLILRHFEELTNQETARVLKISQQAASLRYVRALSRLKHVLTAIPEFQ
ncbi:sigma-70 family RNA polymerase sigma factor [bacterium]|nr:sigma-70 family RNA polymerase sigma factor [bacterium]